MQTAAVYVNTAETLDRAKRAAKLGDIRTLYGRAWTKQFTASRHALLVGRNLAAASDMTARAALARHRNTAAKYLKEAEFYREMAEHHRTRAERYAEEAMTIAHDADKANKSAPKPPNGDNAGPSGGPSPGNRAAPRPRLQIQPRPPRETAPRADSQQQELGLDTDTVREAAE